MPLLSYCRTWRLRPQSSCLSCFLRNSAVLQHVRSSRLKLFEIGVSGYFLGEGKCG